MGSLTNGVAKYFKFETTESRNILSFSDNVTVKLYDASDLENAIYESSSAIVMIDFSTSSVTYTGTFIIEIVSSSDVEEFNAFYQYYIEE